MSEEKKHPAEKDQGVTNPPAPSPNNEELEQKDVEKVVGGVLRHT